MKLLPVARGLFIVVAAALAQAAGHRDWTELPLGTLDVRNGTQPVRIIRPYDRFGVIPSPIVLTALYDPGLQKGRPVSLQIAHGERQYPAWSIAQPGDAYFIGSGVLDRDSSEDQRALRLEVTVQDAAGPIALLVASAPDLAALGADVAGPLRQVADGLPPSALREYVQAILASSGPQLATAKVALERLARGSDLRVARFAREKLRRIAFAEAEHRVESTFESEFRLGLYAQQCGIYRPARRHLDAATKLNPHSSEAWYRLAEVMERCGDTPENVADALERAGSAAGVTANTWDVSVPILMRKEYGEAKDGERVAVEVEMTAEQVGRIRHEWGLVAQNVVGASGGFLKLRSRFVEVEDAHLVPYGLNAGWLYGPTDPFVPVRGSVDCVMSFHPRGPSVTGGADCGPSGAALTDIGPWAGWEVMLHEWNHQFDWTVRASEAGPGYPITHHSDGCGHQPIPSMGYGHRASMHYYVTPAMYRRLEPADPDNGAGYVRRWHVSQPVEISYPAGEESHTRHSANAFGPETTGAWPREFLESAGGFVDLQAFYRQAGVELAERTVSAATAYVWSEQRQEARLWLGHNDGMALWLNGDIVHEGDYYAIAKFEDRDWPNMVAIGVTFQKGWNRLDCTVEAWPPPQDEGFGFAVRVCDFENKPVPTIRVAFEREPGRALLSPDPLAPQPGRFYRWGEVRDDWYRKLPHLTGQWLADYTGCDGLVLSARIGTTNGMYGGFFAVASPEDARRSGTETLDGVALRAAPELWDPRADGDMRLNNVMDWNREMFAVYPVRRGRGAAGREVARHLLFVRPEAIEACIHCLVESPAAQSAYGVTSVGERVLGIVQVGEDRGEESGVRVFAVFETILRTPLPFDEEDLLSPVRASGL